MKEMQWPKMQTFCQAADVDIETPHFGECQRCHNHRSSITKWHKFSVHVLQAKC